MYMDACTYCYVFIITLFNSQTALQRDKIRSPGNRRLDRNKADKCVTILAAAVMYTLELHTGLHILRIKTRPDTRLHVSVLIRLFIIRDISIS